MNERVETIEAFKDSIHTGSRTMELNGDFGPVVLYQGQSVTLVSFGPILGLGAFLSLLHTWFYLGSYQLISQSTQLLQLALLLAIGIPVSGYVITRALDLKTYLSGEKSFTEYIRTVSFGFWGGLLGTLIILTSFSLYTGTALLGLFDAFAVGLPLAQMLGRLGCLNYGCCHGRECRSKHQFGIQYFDEQTKVLRYDPNLKGKHLYPTQIYAALGNMMVYLILLAVWLLWDTRPVGALGGIYAMLYGVKRFSVEFLRGEFPRIYFLGFTLWQWFSFSFFVLGLAILTFVLISGSPTGLSDWGVGYVSLKTSVLPLLLSSIVFGLAHGVHGRAIGRW